MTDLIKTYIRVRTDELSKEIAIDETQNRITICGKQFDFDGFLKDQEHVFREVGEPMVNDVLEGYHATLFAYGQSGSGKTYTICGCPNAIGLVPRIAASLINDRRAPEVQVSFMQIYNDQLTDLITDAPMKWNDPGVDTPLNDVGTFWKLYTQAEKKRPVQATDLNDVSSRSHLIVRFTVDVKQKDGRKTTACLHCIDLCGSERLKSSHATGSVKKETESINTDLLQLGIYVDNVANAQTKRSIRKDERLAGFHYTTLNRLIGKHIDGYYKTSFVITILPLDRALVETTDSLRFGSRVRGVKINPEKNFSDSLVTKYKLLQEENRQLREIIAEYELEFERMGKPRKRLVSVSSVGTDSLTSRSLKPSDLAPIMGKHRRPSIAEAFSIDIMETKHPEEAEEEDEVPVSTMFSETTTRAMVERAFGVVGSCTHVLKKKDKEIENLKRQVRQLQIKTIN